MPMSLWRQEFSLSNAARRSDTELPTLFLDVDGVLNAFQLDPTLATFDDFEDQEVMVDEGNGFRMILDLCLSRSMGKRIGALSAEIVWATTWEHNADSM
jgi:hypothetical protein